MKDDWKSRQTPASVTFVGDAALYMESEACGEAEREQLDDLCERIRRGTVTLQKFLLPRDYLANPEQSLRTATEA